MADLSFFSFIVAVPAAVSSAASSSSTARPFWPDGFLLEKDPYLF